MKTKTKTNRTPYLSSTTGFAIITVSMLVPLIQGPYSAADWYQYLYAAGALIMLVCDLMTPYRGTDQRLKRLRKIQTWASVIFCVAAVLIFIPGTAMRDWVAFSLAGAVLRAYSAIAMANRQRKKSTD